MRLAVLGDPVEHSLSPLLHQTALRECGLAGTYQALTVDAQGMERAVEDIRRGTLDGANVTMPHKHLAYELCDLTSADAARTEAVNTLVRVGDDVVGHNTDITGIGRAWNWAGLADDAPVDLYGAGGAAAAALVALDDRDVTVHARRAERAEELTARIGGGRVGEWGPPQRGAIIVNATPIGMRGGTFPDEWLDVVSGVFDMAYAGEETPTAKYARTRGIPVAVGQDMLLGQAIDSFWMWTGRCAPVGVMRAAMENES